VSTPGAEFVELFLQEASERLQFLREYTGILLDSYPAPEEIERLYVAAHTLKGSSAMYGFGLFAEVAAKLAHIFQYAMNFGISQETAPPLVEFVSESVAVLESDLSLVSDSGAENAEEIAAFKQKYPFAFEQPGDPGTENAAGVQEASPETASGSQEAGPGTGPPEAAAPPATLGVDEAAIEIPPEGDVGPEILEFFVPEVEEHLQVITECLLALETSPNADDIHRLFRAMHTVKGAAAQVGLPRLSRVAHRAEDLIGRLRDGELKPSAGIVDVCLESVDVLKKLLYRQWPDEESLQSGVRRLLARIARLAPEVAEDLEPYSPPAEPAAAQAPEWTGGEISELEVSELGNVAASPGEQWVQPAGSLEHYGVADQQAQSLPDAGGADFPTGYPGGDYAHGSDSPGADGTFAPAAPASRDDAPTRSLEYYEIADRQPEYSGEANGGVSPVVPADVSSAPAETWNGYSVSASTNEVSEPENAGASPGQPWVQPAGSYGNEIQVPERGFVPRAPSPDSASAVADEAGVAEAAAAKRSAAEPPAKSVRIALQRLDRMMNAVGELVINRTRMLGRLGELEKLADVLNFSKARMTDKLVEFQDKYEFNRLHGLSPSSANDRWNPDAMPGGYIDSWAERSRPAAQFPFRSGYSSYSHSFDASLAEFGELEMDRYDDFNILSRSLTEISADITEILTQLDGFVRRVDSDIDEFTKLAHRLQDEITQARMVPIGNLYTRISRTARDAAKASGKLVDLELAGADTELDNNIIQQIADPLLHLVRNAVAHGIEREEERYQSGKPDHGKLAVRAYHRGNHIYIEVEDDGRGIDWEHVRSTALHLGLIDGDEAVRLNERQLQDLLFHPGFSTAPRKTELAGRGVGLDVVKTNLSALNGEIEVETQRGFGTRFTLKVPLTLIISQALFVRAGGQTFTFPLAFVEEIRRVREKEIEEVGGKLLTKVRDVVTEVVRLDEQLGLERLQPVNGYYLLVLVNVAGRPVGIVVEEVLHKDEIVIKNLGEYMRNVKLFPGATIAPDGSLILMVDVNRLIAGEAIERRPLMTSANAASVRIFAAGAYGDIPAAAIEPPPEEKVVVLADDSISVRKFVGRMLEKAGYRVKLAVDGLEALEMATQAHCDLVVTDLEMPRTNGYELIAHLRQNPETRNIPVMVVTSRAGAKHKDKALRQGAADFLVKPVQEEQFIAAVNALIKAGTGVAQADTVAG
jgi:chemosensory pili system protein ChpA (sensor histidine kinase/response regulator)